MSRLDLDGKLTSFMESLTRAHGSVLLSPPSSTTSLDPSLFPLLARGSRGSIVSEGEDVLRSIIGYH
jgi:hypothetical protein